MHFEYCIYTNPDRKSILEVTQVVFERDELPNARQLLGALDGTEGVEFRAVGDYMCDIIGVISGEQLESWAGCPAYYGRPSDSKPNFTPNPDYL